MFITGAPERNQSSTCAIIPYAKVFAVRQSPSAFFAGGETGAKPSCTLHNGFSRAKKNINLRNCFLRASFCHQTKLLLIFSDLNTLSFHGDRLIASTSGKRNTHDFVRIFVLLKHEYLCLYRNCFRNQASKASK